MSIFTAFLGKNGRSKIHQITSKITDGILDDVNCEVYEGSEANLTRKETGRKILNETGRFRVNWAYCIQFIGARSVRYG